MPELRTPCEGTAGQWYCLNCAEHLPNNITADGHSEKGHKLAWDCPDHGYEWEDGAQW